jgi:hypothetical protein
MRSLFIPDTKDALITKQKKSRGDLGSGNLAMEFETFWVTFG